MKLDLLVNGASTKSLIMDTTHKKILKGVKEYLGEDRFNYLVNAENLKDVKKNTTELNKSIGVIKAKGKELVDIESQSINEFKTNIKEYMGLIEAKRLERLDDVKVYEDKTRELVKCLVIDYITDEVKNLSIRDDFRNISYDDLIIVSNINKSGESLASKCRKELDTRLMVQKSKQDRYDMRVLSLENICYKRGLEVPLDENHIQGIIFEDDETVYNLQLDTLINNELVRAEKQEKMIADKIREDEEKKARVNLMSQQRDVQNVFVKSFHMMEVDILEKELLYLQNYDLSKFDLCQDYAISLKNGSVDKIVQLIEDKKQALQDTKEVIEEIVPVEKVIKEVAPIIEPETDGKKNIKMNISLEFTVESNKSDNAVISYVEKVLEKAGLSNAIRSIGIR